MDKEKIKHEIKIIVAPTGNEISVEINKPKTQELIANKLDKIYMLFRLYVN